MHCVASYREPALHKCNVYLDQCVLSLAFVLKGYNLTTTLPIDFKFEIWNVSMVDPPIVGHYQILDIKNLLTKSMHGKISQKIPVRPINFDFIDVQGITEYLQ